MSLRPNATEHDLSSITGFSVRKASFCVFEYLYRDASNYKQHEALLLSGEYRATDLAAIKSTLFEDGWFIPEVVGLSSLQPRFSSFGIVPNGDDHVWHEFADLRPAGDNDFEQLSLYGDKSELVDAFQRVTKWDERSSPIYPALRTAMPSG